MNDGSDNIGLTKRDNVCGVCPYALSLTTVKIQAHHSSGFSCDYEAITY
jgi:hypothetical protein